LSIHIHRSSVVYYNSHLSGGQYIIKSQTHNAQSRQACEQSQPVGFACVPSMALIQLVYPPSGLAQPMETVHRHSLHPDSISQQNRLLE
jgi:hypothetical protein